MRVRSLTWLCLVVGVAACTKMTADPIVTTPLEGVMPGDTTSNDPYACAVVQVGPGQTEIDGEPVYRFLGGAGGMTGSDGPGYAGICKQTHRSCWLTGDTSPDCAQNCGGFSFDGTGVHGGQHMVCEYICETDADCPTPTTGTARPTCWLTHACLLGCGAGETCPDGFRCISPDLSVGNPDGSLTPMPKSCVQYKAFDGPLPF